MRSLGHISQTDYAAHGGQAWVVVRDRTYASGHRERTAALEYTLSEVPSRLDPLTLEPSDPLYLQWLADGSPEAVAHLARQEADHGRAQLERLARASRRRLRQKVLASDYRVMLTLTALEVFTEAPVFFELVNRYIERVRRVWPEFAAIYVLELQERGALHAHCAIPKPPPAFEVDGQLVRSYDHLRIVWESVIGGPGRVRVGHREPPGGGKRRKGVASALSCAVYLAKYLGKNAEVLNIPPGHRRFRAPIGIVVPASVVVKRIPLHLAQLLDAESRGGGSRDARLYALARSKFEGSAKDGGLGLSVLRNPAEWEAFRLRFVAEHRAQYGVATEGPCLGNARSWYQQALEWLDSGWSFRHVTMCNARLMAFYMPPQTAGPP